MLKRIFSPGTFTGTVIRSVLLRDVPESVRLSDSAALRQAAEEISLSPHVLGGFVAEVCILWAQLTVVSGDAMDLDSSSFVAASDNSVDFVTASRLETAYFNFFKLCAKKSFEFYFSRRGSLSFNVGPGGNVLVSVSRRGGVLGLLCDVPNASSRSVLEADDLTCNDGTKLCASKLYIAFRKQIQNQGIESRIGLDGIAARLAVFLEHSHDYAPHSARGMIMTCLYLASAFDNTT